MDGGRLRRPHLLGIYFMSKMHTKTIQKIQNAYIKTYEKDVKIYKDIENSQGTLLLQKCRPLYRTFRSLVNCWEHLFLCGWVGFGYPPVFYTGSQGDFDGNSTGISR